MPFERPPQVNEPNDKLPASTFAVVDGTKKIDFDLSALANNTTWTFPAPSVADVGKFMMGDGTWQTVTGLSSIGSNLILANTTGATALPVGVAPSAVLDIVGSTQGQILFRGASSWSALATGTTGQILRTNGAAANPSWDTLTNILDLIGNTRGQILFRGTSAWSALATGTTGSILRTNGAGADPSWATLTSIIDLIGSTQGQILFRGASAWSALVTGTTGQILRTNGAAANPSWDTLTNILDLIGSTQGQILYRDTANWAVLATGTTGSILRTNGAGANPTWASLTSILDLIGATQGQILFRGASGWSVLSPGTTGQLLQTNGAAANPSWATVTTTLDSIGSTQGQILYRGASGWVALSPGTTGQVLQTNGAAANPSWATLTNVITKTKTGGESVTSSVTVQSDDHLNWDIPANETWTAVYEIFATVGTTTNLRTKFLVPAGASASVTMWSQRASDIRFDEFSDATVENVHTYSNATSANQAYFTRIILRVVNSTTAGTVTFQWAQGTSSATALSVRGLSTLRASKDTP